MNTASTLSEDMGIVIRKTIGSFVVQAGGGALNCVLSASLRGLRNPVVVGDRVRLAAPANAAPQITEVLPRRNKLARRGAVPMPDAHAHEQVIAANIDQVAAVFAVARPTPRWNLLDRYLTAAESMELPALICLTKADLLTPPEADELSDILADYRRMDYPVLLTSAVSGEGLEELRRALAGRTTVLVGKSGVGKSSLLNALDPSLSLAALEVSRATGKGRHTTSHLEMFPLAGGGAVVDTPGTREFGLWDVDGDDMALYFREMRQYVGRCKFGLTCRHDEEPGCAIRAAVMAGDISPRRYQSYMRLAAEA